jgi:hypothetical protein
MLERASIKTASFESILARICSGFHHFWFELDSKFPTVRSFSGFFNRKIFFAQSGKTAIKIEHYHVHNGE